MAIFTQSSIEEKNNVLLIVVIILILMFCLFVLLKFENLLGVVIVLSGIIFCGVTTIVFIS